MELVVPDNPVTRRKEQEYCQHFRNPALVMIICRTMCLEIFESIVVSCAVASHILVPSAFALNVVNK